jgi:hypothetical protein
MLSVGSWQPTRPIPAGFVGLSVEYNTVSAYEGTTPATANPVLAQLIRNLAPGRTPILRIGGDSTDWTWWPISTITPPPGVSNRLTSRWLQRAQTLAQSSGARLILGVNLEADNPRLAAVEADEMVNGIGRRHVAALELGNEPMLYPVLPWYHLASGVKEFGRPASYNLADYAKEFTKFSTVLPRVPLAGPAIGHSWLSQLSPFIHTARGLNLVTFHSYAINSTGAAFRGRNCSTAVSDPAHPSVATLLAPFAADGLLRGAAPDIELAHSRHETFRVDEMNAVTCGGTPGVSDTFASALWALDALFAMADAGVDGVNIHTWRGSAGKLFGFSESGDDWSASVRPEYYGLLMFADAAPAGARLLPTTQTHAGNVQSWATLGSDHKLRVVLINHSLANAQNVTVQVPVPRGGVQLQRLQAPSASATTEITLDGESFGSQTTTGRLAGTARTTLVPRTPGGYTVRVAPASAALLTVRTGLR